MSKITKKDVRRIERKIIRTMYSQNKWGSNHMLTKNLESGFPKHEIKKVKVVIMELIKEGILVVKPTLHGKAVSLNSKKKEKIDEVRDRNAIF